MSINVCLQSQTLNGYLLTPSNKALKCNWTKPKVLDNILMHFESVTPN